MSFDLDNIELLLEEFQPLIYKTLQRLSIQQNHMDFDDYFQELQIKLISIAKDFERKSEDDEIVRYQFAAYASQGLYWHGLSLIRKNKENVVQAMADETLAVLPACVTEELGNGHVDLHIQEFVESAKARLSDEDYALFCALLEEDLSMQDLANHFGVVRDTIYRRRERIQRQLVGLKACLVD